MGLLFRRRRRLSNSIWMIREDISFLVISNVNSMRKMDDRGCYCYHHHHHHHHHHHVSLLWSFDPKGVVSVVESVVVVLVVTVSFVSHSKFVKSLEYYYYYYTISSILY